MVSEKANDRVERKAMLQILQINGVRGKILDGIKSFYKQGSAYVMVAGN